MKLLEKPAPLRLEDILVVTEFPPWADAAVPYALGLARERSARMHVAHAVSTHFFQRITSMPAGSGFRRSWGDAMLTAASRQVLVEAHEIAPRLQAMIRRQDFDLAIVSVGQGGAAEPPLGKAAEAVLKASDCPVLLFGPDIPAGELPRSEPATILYATDFSPQAMAAAQHAFSWAQEYEAWLTMLHVVEGVGASTDHECVRLEEPFRKWMAELVPEELPLWCELEQRVLFGAVAPTIVGAAREIQADLVVIGHSGLDSGDQTILGQTALQVIRQAPCPVLVVREYMTKRAPLEIARDRRSRAASVAAA